MAHKTYPRSIQLGDLFEVIADAIPNEPALITNDVKFTYAELDERITRLANHLLSIGIKRGEHVGVHAQNTHEWVEAFYACAKISAVAINVNYRYVSAELRYLYDNADCVAVIAEPEYLSAINDVRDALPNLRNVIVLGDDYEAALAAASPDRDFPGRTADDVYVLYTGGTTGMPKGVMWRQGDALVECFGGSRTAESVDDFLAETKGRRALVAPPFMHGAGHWIAFGSWNAGGTVFVPSIPERLDPHDIWSMVEQEKIDFLLIVGDAFARPLIDQLKIQSYDLSTLTVVISGGAALSAHYKDELLALVPHLLLIDGLGSSEAGGQLTHMSAIGGASTGTFPLAPNNHVLSSDYSEVLQPGHVDAGHPDPGWLAKSGRLALGYLGDAEKTAKTYPVINGVRYVVPGDRAVLTSDGFVEMRGRDSVTINSGGEKIFAEEVEMAVKSHGEVLDCVVTGRPSERWGNEVVAIVRLREGSKTNDQDLLDETAKHIARYKLPKEFIYVDHIVRSPSGKADYRWAKSIANPA